MVLSQLALAVLTIIELRTVSAGVPLQRYEALLKQQSAPVDESLGLYDNNDQVVKMTVSNFNETVLEQSRGSLVEFYNTYCGHCRRFAPTYKEVAQELHAWREVVIVAAIDCAAEENNGICRAYEVMGYPTLRYMGPGFQPAAKHYGQDLSSLNVKEIRSLLALLVAAENPKNITNTYWPNFNYVSENDSKVSLFEGSHSQKEYVALIHEPENSTLAIETALYLTRWPSVEVRRISDTSVANKFQLDSSKRRQLALMNRQGQVQILTATDDTSVGFKNAIETALTKEHFTPRPEKSVEPIKPAVVPPSPYTEEMKLTLDEVKRNKHFVYQADLEQAIRTILHNEVPKVNDIGNDRLLALQRFLTVLNRYNPLGFNGRQLIGQLKDYVVQFNQQQLTGKQFEMEVQRLETLYGPIYSSTHFVGCIGSSPHLRGFSCSLWTLFHFMTVQASQNDDTSDPLEVLQAMHGYIKNFFGCTDCADHFQAMASRRKIWSVPNKDEAILWLWAAHNEVNQRLAGDATEDPQYPKIQYPSTSSCVQCYRNGADQPVVEHLAINWNKDAVLGFLKNIYNPEFVSRFGVQKELLLPATAEQLREKRQIANVFSDMDMRMGMLLYAFCIVMMVLAFKLFAFKGGYRKKPYGHDMLGKV
ncbi:uncharacterized protein Dwil_GK14087, isoform A [Drosophila willistoni]|uniref:Sulfhydryl oxidase n=1 Tax=Drosophila willistoni TaxID=7260 RepID=B4NLD8_DROWI|nr:sulfhydryl oxidase 1 [Drosophila willistoni]EDW84341.1 uncharacterized protein Dwil_GK14087, isoform A [Drosophila willistoni]